ncbi:hypothetical protein [Deinococcus sp. QL22]|uniref:hypothetical protein n=1 Tax=Deinococcus sp. QL22 TaxID=2939437 RepID=UPI002016D2DB|nr:hypothetical protein [Deinococcus sp. QL22]UQN10567.1 hypothetical protein M1R55_30675 [Deinococcus sp. QL22]
MSWEMAFKQWRERPYPSRSSIVGTVDPVLLDADLVAQLEKLQRGGDAFVVFELARMRDAIVKVLPHLHGDGLSYFIEAVEVADLALAERTQGHD